MAAFHAFVAAVETGGRWDPEALGFVVELAKARSRAHPAWLQRSVALALVRRWTGRLSFAIHDALPASLVEDQPAETLATDGPPPPVGELLSDWLG